MDTQRIISHMNEHHQVELVGLLKKFGQINEPKNAKLISVDVTGLNIGYDDGRDLRVEFPQKVAEDGLKNAVIELCQSVPKTLDFVAVKKEMREFIDEFGSVVLSTLSEKGEPIASYAPLLRDGDRCYIYVSEVSEHYGSLVSNPDNVEVLFLEDESKAKSVILRKRLRFRARAKFVDRGSEFDRVFDNFIEKTGGGGGIKTIRKMMDFHLVALEFGKGRFVKGFGQAYNVINGEISYVGGEGNPHKLNRE